MKILRQKEQKFSIDRFYYGCGHNGESCGCDYDDFDPNPGDCGCDD